MHRRWPRLLIFILTAMVAVGQPARAPSFAAPSPPMVDIGGWLVALCVDGAGHAGGAQPADRSAPACCHDCLACQGAPMLPTPAVGLAPPALRIVTLPDPTGSGAARGFAGGWPQPRGPPAA